MARGKRKWPHIRREVLRTLERLRKRDLIRVIWIDASLTRNVHTERRIPNGVIGTYKHTPGFFIGVYEDERYHEPHILISVEDTDSTVQDVQSMPLATVMKITILQEVVSKIQEKEVVLVTIPSLKIKRAERIIEFSDGEEKVLLEKTVKNGVLIEARSRGKQ